jgi:hypothetical protein
LKEHERKIDVSEIATEIGVSEEVVLPVLTRLNNGNIDDAIARFAEAFTFNDRGIGLEFKDKQPLTEFFQKTREFFPECFLRIDSILVSVGHVVSGTLHTTVTEPFYGGVCRRVQVLLRGVSIVRTKSGKITDWSDYYDGLTSRRTALAVHFEEWVEL